MGLRAIITSSCAAIIAVVPLADAAARSDLEACVERRPAARLRCLTRMLGQLPGPAERLEALQALGRSRPDAALEAIDDSSGLDLDSPTLDRLRGELSERLGRHAAAAVAFESSWSARDATTEVVWLTPDAGPGWQRKLDSRDPDSGLRAAAAWLAAGDLVAARRVAGRLIERGGGDDARELWRRAGGSDDSILPDDRGVLRAGTWYPSLPTVEIELLDGGSFDTSQARGEVLLLDFWATWCEPCVRSLPRLQTLQEQWSGRGLRVITVNSGEPPLIALDFLDALGVDLPVGAYGLALQDAMPLRSLPTLVLIGPDGRLRARWNGYGEGMIDDVTAKVTALLDGSADERESIAEIRVGADLLDVVWARRAAGVGGLAVVTLNGESSASLLATTSDGLQVIDADGAVDRRRRVDSSTGRFRTSVDDQGLRLFAFRRGGQTVVSLDDQLAATPSPAPGYLLDIAPLRDPSGVPSVWTATTEGVHRRTGQDWLPVGEPREVRALAAWRGGVAALEAPARVSLLDLDGAPRSAIDPALTDAWQMTTIEPQGIAIGNVGVTSLFSGRFDAEQDRQLVVTTRSGELMILDPADGSIRFRAVWPRIDAAAAGDLDGDGLDELFVAAAGRIVMLAAPD